MRWSGKLGFTELTEVSPGRIEDVITEHPAMGDVDNRTGTVRVGDEVLPQIGTTTAVSVLFGSGERLDFSKLRYVTHRGTRWVPSSIVEEPPRVLIFIGEEYNGPGPAPADEE